MDIVLAVRGVRRPNFPSDRLPDWPAAIDAILPIQAMGDVIACLAMTGRVLTRRG